VEVTQSAEEITLDKAEVTVDIGRTAMLKATVLPKETNNKQVVWTSSDESIAKVNAQGRITGVALGECEIICTSKEVGTVQAKATVRVQQPVKKIAFGAAPIVYVGETAKLTWTVEPADASNQVLKLTSANPKALTVSEDGTVTGVAEGEAYVRAVTTDGSNRQAKVLVKVRQHLTGVHMRRKTAYIDPKQTSTAGAVLEPEKARYINRNMTWESADTSIATVVADAKEPNKVKITAVNYGQTIVTGITEDGGFPASITVWVDDWEKSLKITEAEVRGADAYLKVKNLSVVPITSITAEVTVYDIDGNVVPSNRKDPKKPFKMVYKKRLEPNASTREENWQVVDFMLPDSLTVSEYVIKITEFEIDHDWIKTIRQKNQPTKKCPVHI
jgi:uncharacterized protein YjdB